MNYERKQVKLRAKELIRTARPKAWVVTLLYVLLAVVAVEVVTALAPSPLGDWASAIASDPEFFMDNPQLLWSALGSMGGGMALTVFISVLTSLYQMVMSYGYVGYCLKLWRGEPTAYGNVFGGFSIAGKAIGASVMVCIYTYLWSLLLALGWGIVLVVAIVLSDSMVVLPVLLFVAATVILVVGAVCISYRYCLTPYFLTSDPDMGVFAAITASKNAMRGKIGKRLALDLSFLGWDLLVGLIIALVIGVGTALVTLGSRGLYADLEPGLGLLNAGIGGILVVIVAVLAVMPLYLWLTAYQGVAEAGFFQTVAQGNAPAGDASYAYGGTPPIPPAPPVSPEPPVPPAPPMEAAPVFEAPEPETPKPEEAPEAPAEPETPGSEEE